MTDTQRRTKTVATLGPLLRDEPVLARLIGLPGPTPRIGALSRPLTVRAEEIVTLGSSAAAQAPVNFPELLPHVFKGELFLVVDGDVALEALSDGTIASRKGANLPDTQLPSAALTEVDSDLLAWNLQEDIDSVALSFVRAGGEPSMRPHWARETARRGSYELLMRRSHSAHHPRTGSA
jgi:pyruvate kinase